MAVLVISWLFILGVEPWSDDSAAGMRRLSNFAARLLEGEVPYRDFAFEYPPLSAPFFAVAGLIAGTDEQGFRYGIGVIALIAYVCTIPLVARLARSTGGDARMAAIAVALSPLLLGAVVRLHLDVVAVALVVAALLSVVTRRDSLGLALLAIAALVKGFPLAAVPIVLAWIAAGRGMTNALRAAGTFGVVMLLGAVLWFGPSPEGGLASLSYHAERPVQIESTPASFLAILGALGSEDPVAVQSHHSTGVAHPVAEPVSLAFTGALTLTVLLLTGLAAWRARPHGINKLPVSGGSSPEGGQGGAAQALVLAVLAVLAAGAALGSVLSPQFLIWVVPLGALAFAWRMPALTLATAAACALTLLEFPDRYPGVRSGEAWATTIVAVRNAALILVVGLVLATLIRTKSERSLASSKGRAEHDLQPVGAGIEDLA